MFLFRQKKKKKNYDKIIGEHDGFRVVFKYLTAPSQWCVFTDTGTFQINRYRPTGELNVNLVNDKGVEVPLQVNDNEDGSFLIDYVPTSSGVHSLNCTYGGVKVPDTPIKINVQSPVDLSKVKVDGLETRKLFDDVVPNKVLFLFYLYKRQSSFDDERE